MRDREIFEQFLHQEAEIKESWRVVEFFEKERAKWSEEKMELEERSVELKRELEELERRALESEEEMARKDRLLKEREEQLKLYDTQLSEREQSINEGCLPEPSQMGLKSVEVISKSGGIIRAKPARAYFSEGYVAALLHELDELKGNKGLREKVLDLELENFKLKVELRDLLVEQSQGENPQVGALDSHSAALPSLDSSNSPSDFSSLRADSKES